MDADFSVLESNSEESDDELLGIQDSDGDDETSSEEEVLPIHSDSEEDDLNEEDVMEESDDDLAISDSDISQNEEDIPGWKAWGKKKKNYYNADNINDKTNLLTAEEEEAEKLEEQEARLIQKRLLSGLDDNDLSLDLLTDVIAEKKDKGRLESLEEEAKIKIDLSQMNESEKIILVKKESPELLIYIDDYKRLMPRVRDELAPVSKMLKKINASDTKASEFINAYLRLILNYCTNITFYVLLKLRRIDTRKHPCTRWLDEYKEMINKNELVYEKLFKSQIKHILKSPLKSIKKLDVGRPVIVKSSNAKKEAQPSLHDQNIEFESDADMEMVEGVSADGKRPITYQIAKNKGLTPHRKKELRNPRVKHRMKYRKAKIRRKGQVREVRKEIKKYDGEFSGIKLGTVKSIKF